MGDTSKLLAEVFGTAMLILLGNGVVANVVLRQTKGNGGGWIVITAGWGFAVYTAVLCVADVSGAHLNPAVSIGLATAGRFPWNEIPGYVIAQMIGGILGAVLVYLFYMPHYAVTEDANAKLATFCTGPAIRTNLSNFLGELIGTFVLIFAVLVMSEASFVFPERSSDSKVLIGLGSIGAVRVGLVVFAIGLCLGGTTGYAINPARDLGPRIAHAFLPIPGKRDSDWSYAWIPVVGPVAGGVLAAVLYNVWLRP
jgi:glycerol uptake facilitator protein